MQESAGKWVESRDSQVNLQGSCKSSQAVKQVMEWRWERPGGTILSVPYRKGPMIGSKKCFSTLRESWPSTECAFMPKFWIVIALVTGYLFFMDIPRSCLLDYIPRGLI